MKNAFLQQILAALVAGAAQNTLTALQASAPWQSVGVFAGAGALQGVLAAILSHPRAQIPQPVVKP